MLDDMRDFKLYEYKNEKVLYEIKGESKGRVTLKDFMSHVHKKGFHTVRVRDKNDNDVTNETYVRALRIEKKSELKSALEINKNPEFKKLLKTIEGNKDLSNSLDKKLKNFPEIKVKRPLHLKNLGPGVEVLTWKNKQYVAYLGTLSRTIIDLIC